MFATKYFQSRHFTKPYFGDRILLLPKPACLSVTMSPKYLVVVDAMSPRCTAISEVGTLVICQTGEHAKASAECMEFAKFFVFKEVFQKVSAKVEIAECGLCK